MNMNYTIVIFCPLGVFITVIDLTWRIDLKRLEKLAGKCVLRIPLRDFVLIVHFMEPQVYVVESTTDAHGRIVCTKLITLFICGCGLLYF
jgi:hypothetical protein